jgi:formylglycine-generating enzyme required for sulfatase activity
LVQSLLNADTAKVPEIIRAMSEYRPWVDPLLRKENDKAALESRQRLHTSLALLPVDESQINYLTDRLLGAAPADITIIREALLPHQDELREKLWAVVEAPEGGKEGQRLHAAAALAKYGPQSLKWEQCGALVVNDLVQENPLYLLYWSEAFAPVKPWLLKPLAAVFRAPEPERADARLLAANLLADYAADNPELLADLLMDADAKQFALIYPRLNARHEHGLSLLIDEIDKRLPDEWPSSDERREYEAKRRANAAVALLRMDQAEKVWPLLRHSPDPRARSYLIHRLSPLGADPQAILKRLDDETDITIRRALLLSLGEFTEKQLPIEARQALLPKLQALYCGEADPGLHAATQWLLRAWNQQDWLKHLNDQWAEGKTEGSGCWVEGRKPASPLGQQPPPTTPRWYVNGQGQTMVVLPGPVEFMMGSPLTERDRKAKELLHQQRIGRSFALAATPVTKEQFLRFQPEFTHNDFKRYPYPDCPIGGVNWYEAAGYCNWLSQQEGIPEDQWCYEIPKESGGDIRTWKFTNVRLKPGYLRLTGYRLPTEAEWEYACRAEALTSRFYGETAELLTHYGWYYDNSPEHTQPVGSKKPNDWGLFDMHGNVWNWCEQRYREYVATKQDDVEDSLHIRPTDTCVWRGSSFYDQAAIVRSATRGGNGPTFRFGTLGLRPARTVTP